MASVWVQVLLVVCALGLAVAWHHPGYYMSRRGSFCRRTGQSCLENGQCCSAGQDVCATPYMGMGGGRHTLAICKPRYELQKGFKANLSDGATCKSSGQCKSGCCRENTRGRFARTYVCGTITDDVMCADYSKATYLYNDILEDY